jgi:energy-coupling factor transporter ATP-binding protein EcfA2
MQTQRALTIEEVCEKLKPIFGTKIDDIYLKYVMADTREEKEEIFSILNALYHKNLQKLLDRGVLLAPPTENDMQGEYPLGKVSYAGKQLYDFNLREKDWPRHVCITGMSGSGKTTLAFHIINNFIEQKKPFFIFDWKKSFRPIVLENSEVMDFTIGNDAVSNLFKMNINEPPKDVDPKEWINVLCDLLTESFMVSFGVHKILLETLDEAFNEWGIYEGSKNYPTWNHIKWRLEQKMAKANGREGTWIESALRIATVLTFGHFGKVCNYKGKNAIKVEELLNKNVVFELNALSSIEKKFFCEFVLTYIFKLKKARQTPVENEFDHVILVDEAHNIFLKEKTHFVKESVTDMIYREMREYGTSLICLDQHISKLSDTVKGNSAVHIAFQQQLPDDIRDISGIMQLFDKRESFSKLVVGSAIVKLVERYTNPFLINVPAIKLNKLGFKDSEIKSRMDNFLMQKDVEDGNDEEFEDKIKQEKRYIETEAEIKEKFEKLKKEESWPIVEEKKEVSVPNHALYDGELEKAKQINIEKTKKIVEKEIIQEEKKEITPSISLNQLTSIQETLLGFVEQQINLGKNLAEIERIMEKHPKGGVYTLEDVSIVMNYFLTKKLKNSKDERVIPSEEQNIQKVYKTKKLIKKTRKPKDTTDEQSKFIYFLQANPDHDLCSVEVYKQVGLSARKGTRIKNELLGLGKIKIIEQKNSKGWKKIIRLA